MEVTAQGGKSEKRKELEEESGKRRKLGKMRKRWKIGNQGEERGRGNGIKDEEGKIKAVSLMFSGLSK